MLAMVASLDALFLLLFFLVLGMVLFSSLLYFAEQTQEEFDEDLEEWYYTDDSDDPGKLSPYQSIPHTLWWCIVTMTTVGYGDTFPITPLGKAVAGATMLLGLLVSASSLPLSLSRPLPSPLFAFVFVSLSHSRVLGCMYRIELTDVSCWPFLLVCWERSSRRRWRQRTKRGRRGHSFGCTQTISWSLACKFSLRSSESSRARQWT